MGAMHAQQQAGERTAYDPGQRGSGHEQGDGARPRRGRKPAPQIKDHAGKKSGFGRTQQKTQEVKAPRAGDKYHRSRNDAPDHHDHRDPLARAHLGQSQVAGHLKKEISGKEDSCAQAIDFIAEAQLPFHLQGGKTHVDAIQVGDDIKQETGRAAAPGKLGDDSGAEINSSQRWHREWLCPQHYGRLSGHTDQGPVRPSEARACMISATISSSERSMFTVIASSGSSSAANWLANIVSEAK